MSSRSYFLYRHVRLDKNVPFYIGVGTKPIGEDSYSNKKLEYRRAFIKSGRSSYWKHIVAKTNYRVDILY